MRARKTLPLLIFPAIATVVVACASTPTGGAPSGDAGGQANADPACRVDAGALSRCISPGQDGGYYIAQGIDYFDTIDSTATDASVPNYGTLVARWEWPPWLKLTGYGAANITQLDKLVAVAEPGPIPIKKCLAFDVQPFARCRVSFQFSGGMCPIYEEFTFNHEGQTTFIEAWSDLPGKLPMSDPNDTWGEGPNVHRLSTKLPGLGDAHGLIALDAGYMTAAAAADPEIADFVYRAQNFWPTWSAEYADAGSTLYARGCGW